MANLVQPGGWRAIGYSVRMAREAGWLNLWRGMRSRNACKTCALGMGGQKGGMRNEAGFLLQVLARLYGTNNVNNCSYYCHQPSGVGLTQALGSGTATLTLEDLEHSDLVFLIGANPASNHPRLMTSLMHLKRRGGKVVIVNPVRERGLVRFHIPSDVRTEVEIIAELGSRAAPAGSPINWEKMREHR